MEYSKTQDNSFDNLILVCPNHHQTVPKTQTPEQQKQARAEWYALVSVVRSYRKQGIAFPFGSFVALDYGSEPDPLALIEGYKLSNATALDLARTTFAKNAVADGIYAGRSPAFLTREKIFADCLKGQ